MYTTEAFNNMLMEFLNDLCKVFPDRTHLQKYQTLLRTGMTLTPDVIVYKFMDEVRPYSEKITQRDPSYFSEAKGEFTDNLKIKELWESEMSDKTRDCIWKYLNTLVVIGTIITSMDKDMLSGIESMATKMMDNPNAIDLSKMVGSLGSILGPGGLDSLSLKKPPSERK